jgi:hypothetical protein
VQKISDFEFSAVHASVCETENPSMMESVRGDWQCTACTYVTLPPTKDSCEICLTPRFSKKAKYTEKTGSSCGAASITLGGSQDFNNFRAFFVFHKISDTHISAPNGNFTDKSVPK